jgi:hypothetical protein
MSNPERAARSRHGSWALRLLLRAGIVGGVIVAGLQAVLLAPLLPDPMPAGLGAAWSAGALAHPPAFLMTHLVVVASTAAIFLAVPPLLRASAWWRGATDGDALEAERFTSFEQWTLLLGLVTTTFTVVVVQYVVLANLARPPHLGEAIPFVLATTYLAFAATWAVQVVRRFRHEPVAVSATAQA